MFNYGVMFWIHCDVAILIRTRKVEYYEAENSNVKTDHQNIPFRI